MADMTANAGGMPPNIPLRELDHMTSTIRRVEGGGWSKTHRFGNSVKDTPGPIYSLPSLFNAKEVVGSHHVQGPVMRPESEDKSPRSTMTVPVPHPTRDRTAWMIGHTKDDMAFYKNIASNVGPAFYRPSWSQTQEAPPRTMFPKNGRFDSGGGVTSSPGPTYYPSKGSIDLNKQTPPRYSFGSKNLKHRSSFLDSVINGGYLYNARPATSDRHAGVSPATYAPNTDVTTSLAPRPKWSKADRFATHGKIFISRKHSRSMGGMSSPGPIYSPKNGDVSTPKPRTGTLPGGTWCP